MRSTVVLPAPFGPSRPSTRPCSTVNETSFTALEAAGVGLGEAAGRPAAGRRRPWGERVRRPRSRASTQPSTATASTAAIPASGPSGTVVAVSLVPGTHRHGEPAGHPDLPDGGVGRAGEALVGGRDRDDELVAGLDGRDHAGQRDRDRRGTVGGHRHPHRRDRAAEQRPPSVRGQLGDPGEQDGLRRGGLARHAGDAQLHPRGACHHERGLERWCGERGGLARHVRRGRGEPAGDRAEGAAESRAAR